MNSIYQKLYKQVYGKRECSDVISAIAKFSDTPNTQTVYDIGCGQGRLFERLSGIFNQYYGIDIDQDALNTFNHNFPEAVISNEVNSDWLSADVIIFYFNVLNYFSYDDYILFFEKLRKNLSKKTIFFYYFLSFDEFEDKPKTITRNVTLADKKYLLSNKIYKDPYLDSYVFEEYIDLAGEIIFKQANSLFNWNSKKLEQIHRSLECDISILSDTQKTMRNVETIMEISPK